MTSDTEYENRARKIAHDIGLRVKIEKAATQECPKWNRDGRNCLHRHGDHYKVTLYHNGSLTFDFWNGLYDAEHDIEPGLYDVLVCVASDAATPTDPDEVAREYGPMPPSQAYAIARFARRLQKFFTPEELEQLGKIDR